MESRKTVQVNLFAKRNRDTDIETNTRALRTGGEGWMNWETGVDTHTLWIPRIKQVTTEACCEHRELCSVLCA